MTRWESDPSDVPLPGYIVAVVLGALVLFGVICLAVTA